MITKIIENLEIYIDEDIAVRVSAKRGNENVALVIFTNNDKFLASRELAALFCEIHFDALVKRRKELNDCFNLVMFTCDSFIVEGFSNEKGEKERRDYVKDAANQIPFLIAIADSAKLSS